MLWIETEREKEREKWKMTLSDIAEGGEM